MTRKPCSSTLRLAALATLVIALAGVRLERRAAERVPSATLQLRARFPAVAARILSGDAPRAVAGVRTLAAGRLLASLPAHADAALRIEDGAFGFEVSEGELEGAATAVGGAVAFARAGGGSSFWTRTDAGVLEEWLLIDGMRRPPPSWEVRGATLRQYGRSVELLDASGTPRVVVSAPEAFAENGRVVRVALQARGSRIELIAPPTRGLLLVDPAWIPAGNLAFAHMNHATTLLANGEVLVTGGNDPANARTAGAEIYNPGLNSWRSAAPMSLERMAHTATRLSDGRVLVAGGLGKLDEALDTFEIYDPAQDAWSPPGKLLSARWGHTANLLPSGRVLLAGGSLENPTWGGTASAEEFDPQAGASAAVASLLSGRTGHSATPLADGRVLFAAGAFRGARIAAAELYDPGSRTFQSVADMPAASQNHAATRLADGRVLVAGGSLTWGPSNSVSLFDPATEGWSSPMALSSQRTDLALVALLDGTALAIGGSTTAGAVKTVESFDPVSGQWFPAAPLQRARALAGAVLLTDGDVLAAAGGQASAERYRTFAKANGLPCAANSDCATGSCADGVCCDAACDQLCQACSAAAGATADGLCTALSGAPCDDGLACSSGESCQQGFCVPAQSTCECTRDEDCSSQPCRTGRCDRATGTCSYELGADGAACSDLDPCTQGDRCTSGMCQGTPYTCSEAEPCKSAVCDGAGGCVRQSAPDQTPCGGTCDPGECWIGVCVPRGMPCATPPDACHSPGACMLDACQYPDAPDGTACPGGACVGGACVPPTGGADAGAPGPRPDAGATSEDPGGGGGCGCPSGDECGSQGAACASDSDCCAPAICATQRTCIPDNLGTGCQCSGSSEGACIDLSAQGVTRCGAESAAFNACCPGTVWVNGRCKPPGACD